MSVASTSYASNPSPMIDPYHVAASSPSASPVPSPSTPGSLSRWKSVFKMGATVKPPKPRPTFLAVDGQDGAFEPSPPASSTSPIHPTRAKATRANTEPIHAPPAVNGDRAESSGDSYNVHLGQQNQRPTSSTDRSSSRSSNSRQQQSSTSLATSTTPHRGAFGFKSRIFSTPNPEPGSSFLSMSSKGGKKTPSKASSRKKSGGSSISSTYSPASPHTPYRHGQNTSPTKTNESGSSQKSSAAARFLRRVVSAPNTKALLANSPDVPPLPTKSPVVVIDSDQVDLTSSPPSSAITPPPRAPGLSSTGTRANRSLTASAASKKDAQAALGVGAGDREPHHKQVFRRTYSSNSIKTRSVEVSPSSFQKIKLLGKGDVGKVYLVREKKTDKLFAMKGTCDCVRIMDLQADPQCCPRRR